METRSGAPNRSSRIRTIAAAAGSVLCLLAITGCVLLAYTARVLFRPEVFAEKAAASLSEPGVAALLATRLTDSLIEQRRDLIAFRPIILGTAESLVTSAPFRAIVRRAAKTAHETMISETGKDISLSVADASVILRSALATTPELAKKIPVKATTTLASSNEAPGGRIIVRILKSARNLRIGALTLLLFGLLMGAVSFVLATNRRQFLLRIGITLAVIAVILRLAVRFGGNGLALLAKDDLVAGAIAGLWHAFLGGFMTWALVLGGVGLVLAAGVASLFSRVELLQIANNTWIWLTKTHETKKMRLLRGVAFLSAGMMAILSPSFVITPLTLLCGLVVLFIGLREFFGVVLFVVPQHEPQKGVVAGGGVSIGRIIAVSLIILLFTGAGIFYLRSGGAAAAMPYQTIDACNGYPELCDRRLNEVVLPAAHNAMSSVDISDWMFPQQEKSIPGQLQDGIRGFLIDAHYGAPTAGYVKTLLEDEVTARKKYEAFLGKEGMDAAMRIRDRLVGEKEGDRGIYLCHGFCELGASPLIPMLQQMREFLLMNPNDVIILVIQDEDVAPKDIEKCFLESGLVDFVYRGALGPPWPTLRKMIASDQRVVVFAENNSAGVPWYHQAYDSIQETPYKFHKPEDFSCRPNRGNKSCSLFLINHWIETAPAPKPSNAEIVNAYDFLLHRAQQCRRERGMLPNLLAVDFYGTGDLLKVVETLNGITKPKSPELNK